MIICDCGRVESVSLVFATVQQIACFFVDLHPGKPTLFLCLRLTSLPLLHHCLEV